MTNVDQRRFDHRHSDWLGADAACARLGIKRATLYTYASRGLLRSVAGPAGRARRYAREDVERLRARHEARSGHGPVAAGALRWGEPVLDSSITEITPQGPVYRGRAAVELARRGTTFEETAELLWTGVLPAGAPTFAVPRHAARALAAVSRLARDDTPPLLRLAVLVPALTATQPAWPPLPAAELTHARALLAAFPAALGPTRDATTIASALLFALGATRHGAAGAAALASALVLVADHELNASTFAARVAASAGADLHACVSAGLATLSGPRHGGLCDRVEAFVREAGSPRAAPRVLAERVRRGETVPGFGHPLYPRGDPRAVPLLDAARALAPREGPARVLLALVRAMADAGGEAPTVDTGLVAVATALGLRPGAATAIFAVGRAAGWVAHAREQRASDVLLRPRARFVPPATGGAG